MSTARKIGWWTALVLALTVAATSTWLLVTASGLRLAFRLGSPLVPGELVVDRIEGSVVGSIHLEGVNFELGTLRVSIRSTDIEWHPLRLLGGELAIESLQLAGVEIVRSPAAEASTDPFTLPVTIAPPLDVTIETATVTALGARLAADASSLVVDRATFGFRWTANELLLRELVLEGSQLTARGELRLLPRDDYAGLAAFEWSYAPAGYPPLQGVTTLSGSVDELDIVQRLDTPYGLDSRVTVSSLLDRATLDGTVTLQTAAAQLLPDQPIEAISGNLAIAGPIDAVRVSGDLDLRMPSSVDASVNIVSRWENGALAVDSLRINDPGTAAEIELAGQVTLAVPFTINLAGQWSSLQWPLRGAPLVSSSTGSLTLSGTPRELRADLSAEIAGGSVRGTLQRNDAAFTARLDWEDLAYPQSAPTLISRKGALNLEGRPDAYRLNADIDVLTLRDTVAGHVRMSGNGTLDALEIEQVDIAMLGGNVRGRANVGWRPELSAAATLEFEALDPAVLLERWPGRIDGRVDVSIASEAGTLAAEAKALELTGTLRDRPLELRAGGRWRETGASTIDRLDLTIGETSLQARGTLGPANDFTWSLSSPSLSDLSPDLGGSLSTEGRLTNRFSQPTIDAQISGTDLVIGAQRIGSISLMGRVDAGGETESTVDLSLDNSVIAGRDLAQLSVRASGTTADHAITARASVDGVQANIALSGTLEHLGEPDFAWSFRVEDAGAEYAMFAPWKLRSAATGRLAPAGLAVDETCLQSLNASLCLDGTYGNEAMTIRYRLTDLPLQYFAYYLPIGTAIDGTTSASGNLTVAPGAPLSLSTELATTRTWVGPDNASDREGGLAFAPGKATAQLSAQGLSLDISMPLETEDGGITVQASAVRGSGETLGNSALTGVVRAEFADLSFLAEVVRRVADTAGHLSADLELRGTLDRPEFVGSAALTNGAARLLDAGILLENVQATLAADGSRGLEFDAQASSGDGSLRAVGSLRVDERIPVGRIEITGADFVFLDRPAIRAFASPEVVLDLRRDRADLTGRVVVPRGNITLRDRGENTARVSPDQVIVDAESPQATTLTRPFYARLGLELGDAVMFDGLGLKGRLEGALQINETPTEPATGSGELRIVNGTYEAYQQELEIRTGRLLFAGGALSRPGLDVEAVRRPTDDILVGARIRGTLEQPQLTLFSEPSMARQEQLSYLVLGRPLERTSTSETSALSQAALLLGLSGSDMLSDRINRSLGLDEFGIQTGGGEQQTASFVIGRYLAPSLYVSYGIGLFQQANTFKLRYRITDRWRLETESSSEGNGGDVLFHVERGD